MLVGVVSCMSTEEKKQRAEEEGNAIVGIKSRFVKGAGDALKTEGKDAAEAVSEGVGEVFKGANNGLDKSISQANIVTDTSFTRFFELGRSEKLFDDTVKNKRVTVYLVANKSFNGKLVLKAFDESKKEIGRSVKTVKIKADDAQYHDFTFDSRTPLLQASQFSIAVK